MDLLKDFEKRRTVGNYIFLAGLALLLVLNWNDYGLYERMRAYNPAIAAVILTAVFLCYADFKNILKDRMFLYIVAVNIISVLLLFIGKRGKSVLFTVFDLTLALYLSTKICLKHKNDLLIKSAAVFTAFFFLYWTVDVKGYFKGYSINYGGLVLISGFVFTVGILEYIKYKIISSKTDNAVMHFLRKYPFYITFLELLVFIWGWKIISWYRSRTAFFAMLIFGLVLFIPRKILSNKFIYTITTISSVGFGLIFPLVYVHIGKRIDGNVYTMFYKPLFSDRMQIWPQIYELFKNFPVTGIGTLYMKDMPPYRDGVLDTCNSFLELFAVHGAVVAVLVIALLIWVLLSFRNNVEKSQYAKTAYAAVISFIAASYTESFITTVPFMLVFMLVCSIANTYDEEVNDTALTDIYVSLFKGDFGKKLQYTFLVTFFIAFMYFIFAPVEIFGANIIEMPFNIGDFIWIYTACAIALTFIASLIISTFPEKVSIVWSSVLLGIGVASYVQYMFFNADLVTEFGDFASAKTLGAKYYVSIAVYCVVVIGITVIGILYKNRRSIFIYASLLFIVIQLAAMAFVLIQTTGNKKDSHYIKVVDTKNQFEIADEENIIVLLLDSFGRDVLAEVKKQFPGCDDFMHDFTYYDNADSLYCPTLPSLVHLLTGTEPSSEYTREVYEKTGFTSDEALAFYDELHDMGYQVMMYSGDIIVDDYLNDIYDNVTVIRKYNNTKAILHFLTLQSVYRYVPYCLKPYFRWNTEDASRLYATDDYMLYSQNYDAYGKICSEGLNINPDVHKKYSFNHFYGSHTNPANDENCNEVKSGSVTIYQAGAGSLKLIEKYLDELKRLDKYDDSSIVIMADHGSEADDRMQPIFFMKRKGERHDEIEINNEYFKYCDFNRLILELAGGK